MSQVEHYAPGLRWGARGDGMTLHDRLARARVTAGGRDFPVQGGMLETAENVRLEYGISREAQDQLALRSHLNAVAAQADGRFAEEIVPVPVPQRRDGPVVVDRDEHPRADTTLDQLAGLRPVRAKEDPAATVTAGNASGQNDGASACIVTTSARAAELGIKPIARLKAWAVAGVPPRTMGIGPVPSTARALELADLTLADMDLIELNEAFAAQVLACTQGLGPERRRLRALQRQRLGDLARAPGRRHGDEDPRDASARARSPRRALRAGDDVHRRWAGTVGHLRTCSLVLTALAVESLRSTPFVVLRLYEVASLVFWAIGFGLVRRYGGTKLLLGLYLGTTGWFMWDWLFTDSWFLNLTYDERSIMLFRLDGRPEPLWSPASYGFFFGIATLVVLRHRAALHKLFGRWFIAVFAVGMALFDLVVEGFVVSVLDVYSYGYRDSWKIWGIPVTNMAVGDPHRGADDRHVLGVHPHAARAWPARGSRRPGVHARGDSGGPARAMGGRGAVVLRGGGGGLRGDDRHGVRARGVRPLDELRGDQTDVSVRPSSSPRAAIVVATRASYAARAPWSICGPNRSIFVSRKRRALTE